MDIGRTSPLPKEVRTIELVEAEAIVENSNLAELQQAPAEPLSELDPEPSPLAWLPLLRIAFFIGCWYVISITITLYNKWLFSVYGLHFPLLVTSAHIAFKIPAARLLMCCLGMEPVRFDSWRVLLLEVAPSGLAMTGDIGLSNLSFLYTTVT